MEIKKIIVLTISIVLAILLVKFILWLIPVILIGLLTYYIYISLIKRGRTKKYKQNSKSKIIIIEHKDED